MSNNDNDKKANYVEMTSNSSMIELKAELLKKRKEYEESKMKNNTNNKNATKDTTSKTQTKNRDKDNGSSQHSPSTSVPLDDDELRRSREALEAKARLYKKLERGRMLESDLNATQRDNLLVDFAYKGWNAETEEFNFDHSDSSDTDTDNADKSTTLDISRVMQMIEEEMESDDKWVEYEDEFGRLRVCKLGHLRQIQAERHQIHSAYQSQSSHYDGDAEIRNKGVAFYQFAQNEEERQGQMGQLRRLREETVERRMRTLLVKEQRRLLLESRLSKLKKKP